MCQISLLAHCLFSLALVIERSSVVLHFYRGSESIVLILRTTHLYSSLVNRYEVLLLPDPGELGRASSVLLTIDPKRNLDSLQGRKRRTALLLDCGCADVQSSARPVDGSLTVLLPKIGYF